MQNNETKKAINSQDNGSAMIPSVLSEGKDYGRMRGCGKPILYKAGAEKLLLYLELRIDSLDCVSSVTDIGRNFLDFTYKCLLKDSKGDVAGISEGSSNSFEECYRQNYAVKDVNLLSRAQYREKLRSGE
ncbi:MAG: hypothetical protein LWX07_06285, partial [Bacteroidetes bacterium]|nr:hypothetical protein [Bacteroidota bacterium]